MSKRIITIGFEIPGFPEYFRSYRSDQSLLDADLIVFEPNFDHYSATSSTYQGKTTYHEDTSFHILEDTKHWKKELSDALNIGKTVFVFFSKFNEIFIHTGGKKYSGTGRNARVTDIVTSYNNYEFLPCKIPQLISKRGKELTFNHNPIFSTLWSEFKQYMCYESYIDGDIENPLFLTKYGKKPLGGIFRIGKGHLVLLPPLDFPSSKFVTFDTKRKRDCWTEEAEQIGNRLVQLLVDIDNSLRGLSESTPPPEWVLDKEYKIAKVEKIKKTISDYTTQIDKLTRKKNELTKALIEEENIRNLLYEKGKPLENTVIAALHILGYKAENFNDRNLELDSVILSPDGDRFIGEVEGKDSAAINIDKFRQLESNIQEDLVREEVDIPAIGILFGNGFRLVKLEDRADQFTEKCLQNAVRSNTILMRTMDLFPIVRYLKETDDKNFAKRCRDAIKSSRGKIVEFPPIPTHSR
jgi:hypothetical protein